MSTTVNSNLTKSFMVIWVGQAFSLFGSQLVQFALIWHLTSATGSATVLAGAMLVGMLPQIVLGTFIGALVDRWNRRLIMAVSDSLIALATLGLAGLFLLDAAQVQVWHIYTIMFVRALGQSFHLPAMEASTTLMVPEEHLARVSGFNQMLRGLMNIVAPIAGAFLLGILPMQGVLMIDVATALVAIGTLLAVRVPQPARADSAAKVSAFSEMLDGFRYVWAWPGLTILLLVATLLNLFFAPAFSLMPILVTEHFGGGVVELSWFQAALGGGFIIGGLGLGVWGGFKRRILSTMAGLVVGGLLVIGIGILPSEALLAGVVLIGLFAVSVVFVNGPMMAILQATVPADKQGRVMGLTGTLSMAATPIGLIFAGPVADALGVQSWFLVAGGAALIMPIVLVFIPAVMNIEARGTEAGAGAEVSAAPEAVLAE